MHRQLPVTRFFLRLLVLPLVPLALPASAHAQGAAIPPQVQPGARVRVSSPRTTRVSGRVLAADRDSLMLVRDRDADTVRLATSELQSLELSMGQHRRRWRGAGIGFLAGASLGAVLGAATYQKQTSCTGEMFCDLGRGFDAAAGAVLLGGIGTITGAIVGAGTADEWERVMLGNRAALQLFQPRVGENARIGLALRF